MKLAWFYLLVGALLVFEGIAVFITGCYAKNALIILAGIVVFVPAIFLLKSGRDRRRKHLVKAKL
jgi:uncharacterized membrane protein YjjP (DUF1212 family)